MLTKCAEYYGFDWNSIQENAHDSLGDCYATLHCYIKMKEGCLNEIIEIERITNKG